MRQALRQGGPDAAERALADLVDRFTAGRVSVELTHHGHPLDDENNAMLAGLAPALVLASLPRPGAFRPSGAQPAGHGDGAIRAASPWTPRPGGWRHWAGRICAPARKWPGCSRSGPTW
ncbi:error-prone DNA polymerase domain protein [Mycobacterium ulcerans str. Harvey]|uniref:Error-prone DNA polymerase domain protein n=1 Tax=Mycobacterium ulcerans str. Harvey TaxID=1299332 RepID=A0ABN0R496_MYCUL|nr:error-prone DNA polymerase domain protein [Mycobacterium ulcerans str. Harvey]